MKGGTWIDISGGENVSIVGYECGYLRTPEATRRFISNPQGAVNTFSAAGEPKDKQNVIATSSPYAWRVEDGSWNNVVRPIPASNSHYRVDLSNSGSFRPGTPVQLWCRSPSINQASLLEKIQ
jgi:hypothetical protein